MIFLKTRIAELRHESGLTLKQLGDILDVKDNALSQYETGKRTPQLALLKEISNYFHVSLEYLTYSSDQRDYPIDSTMDKTRDAMNGNQRMLLHYLESLVPKDDVLMGLAVFQSKLSEHSVPKEVYIVLGMLSNVEITNVLHELTRPF